MKTKYLLLVVAVFFSFSFLSCDKEEGDDPEDQNSHFHGTKFHGQRHRPDHDRL